MITDTSEKLDVWQSYPKGIITLFAYPNPALNLQALSFTNSRHRLSVVVSRPLPRDGGMADDRGAP